MIHLGSKVKALWCCWCGRRIVNSLRRDQNSYKAPIWEYGRVTMPWIATPVSWVKISIFPPIQCVRGSLVDHQPSKLCKGVRFSPFAPICASGFSPAWVVQGSIMAHQFITMGKIVWLFARPWKLEPAVQICPCKPIKDYYDKRRIFQFTFGAI